MEIDKSKSCSNCPSFLAAGPPVIAKFQKSVGSPMCGRFGHVLGKPGLQPIQSQKLYTHFANKCDSFMEPMPGAPLDHRLAVVMPDIEARDRSSLATDEERAACRSCAACINFVRDDVVANELGWTAGLCAAKGKLILPNRAVYEARNCEYKVYGPIRQNTTGLHLLPEYEDAFNLTSNPITEYFKKKGNFIEPHEWETEREVSDKDKASGIRAWRKVLDPGDSGNEAYLPIYDIPFFSDAEQRKIPRTGDDTHPELYVDHFGGVYLAAVAWTELDETPALWGQAGIGKTELYRFLAWLMCLPFERISITGSTELDDLAGKMHYEPERGTYFQYGRLPLAWTKPSVICIDEPNVGPPDVWQFLRPLTDNSKQLVLDMNEGEALVRHSDCYMGLAMNPAWDVKNVGAQQIGDADASRLFHVYVEMPPPQLEREIIANRVKLDGWEIDNKHLDMIMAIAGELRDLINDGTLPITWAVRPQIKVARAMRWFDTVTAYRRAVGDYLEPEASSALLDVVRSHVTVGQGTAF